MQVLLIARLEGYEVKNVAGKKITELTFTQDSGSVSGFGKKFFRLVDFSGIELSEQMVGTDVEFVVDMYSTFDGKSYRISGFRLA